MKLWGIFFGCICMVSHVFGMNVVFGPDVGIHGMKVGASYIQGVTMSPMMKGMPHNADIHLETDVHALPGNPQGFSATAWIPGLKIHFVLSKPGTNWHKEGIIFLWWPREALIMG